MMNIERLLKNMADQVKELQIKLGYVRETIRLYYPFSSLNALLGTDFSDDKAGREALREELEEAVQDSVGASGNERWWKGLEASVHGDRFEINIPPEGAEYIHQHVEASAFLRELVALFQENHHCSLEEICEVFARAAEKSPDKKKIGKNKGYVCEKMPKGTDFDYVICFEDLSVDEYYYCIKMEMGHTIYHRFMREDYERL